MSVESQGDIIWQYAMRADPIDGDANDASLNMADGRSGGEMTTDFSDQLGSVPSVLSLHGLVQTQTQSQDAWVPQEASSDGPESQKENMHLSAPSDASPPLIIDTAASAASHSGNVPKTIATGNNCKTTTPGHVTPHVTGASSCVVAPFTGAINASATAPSNSALMEKRGIGIRAFPIKSNTKAVSFLSPKAAPSPPSLPRANTMPPRLNRYAPRNIDPSSQDSFAGPLPPEDLNTYVRNQRVFNNTYIRRGRDGRPGEVFEHPTHVSSTTLSLSDAPPLGEVLSSSQSPQAEENPSVSQVVRAAFSPRSSHSPIPVPDPVILVRDSQSQNSRVGKSGSDRCSNDAESGGNASGDGAFSSSSHSPHSHPYTPSSSISYELPREVPADVTQSDTQSTQPSIQPTQTDPQLPPDITSLPSMSTNPDGRSSLPVPPHRQRQIAAILTARLRRAEVIPETPVSTVGPSVQGVTSSNVPAVVEAPTMSPPGTRSQIDQMGKGKVSEGTNIHKKLPSKGKGKAKEANPPLHTTFGRTARTIIDAPVRGPEAIPVPVIKDTSTRTRHPRQSEIVPDSQEEQEEWHDRASSPPVPLIQVMSRRKTSIHPPTPTPAAVKSPLRRGELPEGVTHTRGRRAPNSMKGSRKITGKRSHKVIEEVPPMQDEESMGVDEDQDRAEEQQLRVKIEKQKPLATRSSKVKRERLSKQKKEPKKTRITAGPSTRSRKRKNYTPAGSPRDNDVPLTTSAPPKKRLRNIATATPVPTTAVRLNIRVLARRTDKHNVFFPGTVSVETTPSDPVPASTVFTVQFDDGYAEDVDVEYMRQFQLEPEDVVRVTQRRKGRVRVCSAQVLDVERWETAEVAEVHELDQGPDADDYDVEGRLLSVSEAHIYDQWNERRVSTRTLLRDKDFDQPEPNECLTGMGFILTLPDIPKSKRSLVKLIETSGGVVYDDWSAIVSFNGSVEVAGKRIVGRVPDMRIGKESRKVSPSALFCLTNEPRTTPKYLIALALGVPCLSIDWVLDRVTQDADHYVDWPAYILPAGYNPVTRMPASQAFDRAWWLRGDNVPNLLSEPPIHKPFSGKAFLCIGAPEFLFMKKELGTFPKVLLAMGASYVQAVTEVSRINVRGQHGFDYIVVDDNEALVEYKDAVAVNVSWLKKCLVTGIEGPVPWPDREL